MFQGALVWVLLFLCNNPAGKLRLKVRKTTLISYYSNIAMLFCCLATCICPLKSTKQQKFCSSLQLMLESKVWGDSIRTYFPDSAARIIFWDFHEVRKGVGHRYVMDREYSKARAWLQEIPTDNDPDMLCMLGELFLQDQQDSLGLALLAKAAAMD